MRDSVLALLGLMEFVLRVVMVLVLAVSFVGWIALLIWEDDYNPLGVVLWEKIGGE